MICFKDPYAADVIMVWSDGITAVAYYWLTYQLISFAANSKVSPSFVAFSNHYKCNQLPSVVLRFSR